MIQEKYKILRQGIADLEGRKDALKAEHQKSWLLYNKKLDAVQDAVLSGLNHDEISKLEDDASRLKVQTDRLAGQLKILSQRTTGELQSLISGSASPLGELAQEILDDVIQAREDAYIRLERLLNEVLPEKKEAYLSTVREIGEEFRGLYDITKIGQESQKYCPKDKRVIGKPKFRSMPGNFFEIGLNEVTQFYGHRGLL